MTAINIATIRRLAAAPGAPKGVTISGAISFDTVVKWQAVPGATKYRVYWRRTDSPRWTGMRDVAATSVTLVNTSIDDHLFAVAAIGAGGAESVPVLAGPAPR